MVAILGPTKKQLVTIKNNKFLILQGATWDDYWTLANEDLKVDYIEDRIYIHSPANRDHEEIFRELLTNITVFLREHPVGKVLGSRFPIELLDGKRVEPDILFLSNTALQEGQLTNTLFSGSPTWIIEIVSPTYREHDTVRKRKQYRLLNVTEYWIIDAEKEQLEVIRFKNQKEILSQTFTKGKISPQLVNLSDFAIDLDVLWQIIG